MQKPRQALLLRILIGEDDRNDGHPLYEAIVFKAREMHLAGATVLRGGMGFGHSSRLHTTKILRLSEDLPLVIEIVDSEDKITAFLADARHDDDQRPDHAGKGPGAPIRLTRRADRGNPMNNGILPMAQYVRTGEANGGASG